MKQTKLQKIKHWVIENFQDKNDVEVKELTWLDKKLDCKNNLDWSWSEPMKVDK